MSLLCVDGAILVHGSTLLERLQRLRKEVANRVARMAEPQTLKQNIEEFMILRSLSIGVARVVVLAVSGLAAANFLLAMPTEHAPPLAMPTAAPTPVPIAKPRAMPTAASTMSPVGRAKAMPSLAPLK